MLFRIANHYVNNLDDAQDIVQNVFIKLIKKQKKFESEEHEKAWLISVTINQYKDHLKSSWYQKITVLDNNIISTVEDDRSMLDLVFRLPDNYKQVIYLYYYENYTTNQIATILQVNKNTIMSWLNRAEKS